MDKIDLYSVLQAGFSKKAQFMWNIHRQAQFTLCGLFLTAAIATPGYTEIYQTTDEQGRPVFTDQPPSGQPAEKIKLQPTNIAPPPVEIPAFKKTTPQATAPESNNNDNPAGKSEPAAAYNEDISGINQNNKDNLVKEVAKTHFDKTGTDKTPGEQQKMVDQKLKHLPEAQRNQIINAAKKGMPTGK